MPYKDQEKARAARRAHYEANKDQYRHRNLQQRQRNQEFLVDYLLENTCVDCGESDIRCLQFDHKDATLKSFNIGKAVTDGLGLESIQKEIDKCDVRCANCHSKRTAEQFGWFKHYRANNTKEIESH